MITSSKIRQSFLDFFKSKQHTIVPSSSLLPDSPNLLFTNAGMNQFVPIFLGQAACPYTPGRAADTQKCIRAGGKHNDLEDVGLDTYHHTFFEMLGNWSFGDYFKREAIEWAWELVHTIWQFPASRLYATVFCPYLGEPGWEKKWAVELEQVIALAMTSTEFIPPNPNASPFEIADQEAAMYWAKKFSAAGCDPAVHIIPGNKKDNFWMMGETGPCGPCSELHVDLTPDGQTRGALVNKGDARCIEIWNLVFIQFNANPDGTYATLPARHVDTGMGFERVTSIIQGTNGLKDFANAKISNYETDIFRPIFDAIEKLCGQKYGSTLPRPGSAGDTEQEKMDVAFRVIGDHIRTLSFAIADGIQPGNTDRNYVLRRILRRAVRYGRTLGFQEPFLYRLVDVLAETMGEVFPEIIATSDHVQQIIKGEEETFNRTLDRGIELFNEETAKLLGSAPAPGAADRALAVSPGEVEHRGAKHAKRRLPHFERPWGKYMVTFSTREKRQLAPAERDLVMASVLFAHDHRQYQLFAACVMPDHVHLLFEPQIKAQDERGKPVFYSLSEILQGIKSTTAHKINKAANVKGAHVWEEESFDRLIRGDSDLEEKFRYICRNPWDNGVAALTEDYRWLWTPDAPVTGDATGVSREGAGNGARGGRAPRISGAFAFRLYDEQGFPLDLTELMARERELTVDVEGFNKLMDEQRARARAAQEKTVIELSQLDTTTPTRFVGYDQLAVDATVLEVVSLKDKTAVILDASACYADMGGQVGDTGELTAGGQHWRIVNTQKSGNTWLHLLESENLKLENAPAAGSAVKLSVDANRRHAIERHHTVTHLLHWALHEVVSREAAQKGSFVGPDKLTFDFNSAALTPQQVADIEKLVNERILENAGVSWSEVSYADVKPRKDVMQFFGDKYGDTVRVVQIGGGAGLLNGYSMELCGGTHTRATGEIGLFRIVGESAIAAGVRRIEAVAGLTAFDAMKTDRELIKTIAGKVNSPLHELDKKIESLLAHQKELEKQIRSAQQREAAGAGNELLGSVETIQEIPAIIRNLGGVDGNFLQAAADSLKGRFKGVIVLGGAVGGAVALVAAVSPEFTGKIQAGKIIQAIAPIVGGKGGGKPDHARGGGKDAAKLDEALKKVKVLLT